MNNVEWGVRKTDITGCLILIAAVVIVSIVVFYLIFRYSKRVVCKKEVFPDKDKPTSSLKLSNGDKTKMLMEMYNQNWLEVRLVHDMRWKNVTFVTTISGVLTSLMVFYRQSIIALFTMLIIVIAALSLVKEREAFLKHIMIISRIERLFEMHKNYPEFKDEVLLPKEFIDTADLTYEEYIKKQKWKKRTSFFYALSLYIILALLQIILSLGLLLELI